MPQSTQILLNAVRVNFDATRSKSCDVTLCWFRLEQVGKHLTSTFIFKPSTHRKTASAFSDAVSLLSLTLNSEFGPGDCLKNATLQYFSFSVHGRLAGNRLVTVLDSVLSACSTNFSKAGWQIGKPVVNVTMSMDQEVRLPSSLSSIGIIL